MNAPLNQVHVCMPAIIAAPIGMRHANDAVMLGDNAGLRAQQHHRGARAHASGGAAPSLCGELAAALLGGTWLQCASAHTDGNSLSVSA